jgi:hypothetical protein
VSGLIQVIKLSRDTMYLLANLGAATSLWVILCFVLWAAVESFCHWTVQTLLYLVLFSVASFIEERVLSRFINRIIEYWAPK